MNWDRPGRRDPKNADKLRHRWYQTREFFRDEQPPTFKVIKVLGYGGNGIVMKVEHRLNMFFPPRELIFKISLRSWEDEHLRDEIRIMRVSKRHLY